MGLRKQSTAYNRPFSFIGVSLTSLSVTISKDGGAFASAAGTLSQITGNFYKFAGAAGDADTLGDIAYKFSDTVLGVIAPNDDTNDQVVVDLPGTAVNATQIGGSTTAATNLKNAYAAFETGTAQAGGASTFTLRSGASAVNDFYKDQVVFIYGGTGAGQTNRISTYVGATKVATVTTTWVTQPDNTSTYVVLGRVG